MRSINASLKKKHQQKYDTPHPGPHVNMAHLPIFACSVGTIETMTQNTDANTRPETSARFLPYKPNILHLYLVKKKNSKNKI